MTVRVGLGVLLLCAAVFLGFLATDPGVGDPPCAFDGTGCSEEELAGFDAGGDLNPGALAVAALIGLGGLLALFGPVAREALSDRHGESERDES